jgi:sugar lactone lactonase YvrE
LPEPVTYAEGLLFPECPRWHGDHLTVSDMWARSVYAYDLDGARRTLVVLPEGDEPGGHGYLPDGSLLVVGMFSRSVWRVRDGERTLHADLTALVPFAANDMVVTPAGVAYVTQLGRDIVRFSAHELASVPHRPVPVIRVDPDSRASPATDGLLGPNGIAVDGLGQHLYVAEPGAQSTMHYRVTADGLTSGVRFGQLASLDGGPAAGPDGICLDAEGAVWWTDPIGRRVVRMTAGGRVTDDIRFEGVHPTAVALGGPDRRQLYICLVERVHRDASAPPPRSRIDVVEVDVPGDGRP